MTTLDLSIAALRSSLSALRTAGGRFYDLYDRTGTTLKNVMPKGLYARALLIIIAPMVVLQSVVAYMFMERHYNLVTQRLSAGVVQDIATFEPAGIFTSPCSNAATGAAAAPSSTSLQRSIVQIIASKISLSGSVTISSTNR